MTNSILKKIDGKWFFLCATGVLYLVVFFINPDLGLAMLEKVFTIFRQTLPVFVSVFILMVLTRMFFHTQRELKTVGDRSGFRGWFIAVIGGIISAGPIYMWYPVFG